MSSIATVKPTVTNIGVFTSPDDPQPSQTFPNPWLYEPGNPATGVPQTFLVQSRRLPRRLGRGAAPRATERQHRMGPRQRGDAGAEPVPHHGVARRARPSPSPTNAVIYSGAVAVGRHPETPTPTGNYYLYVLLQAPDPSGPYGPFAYGLSSRWDTLETFAGGDAEIGIHGNDDASALGSSVSHGCIRMDERGHQRPRHEASSARRSTSPPDADLRSSPVEGPDPG